MEVFKSIKRNNILTDKSEHIIFPVVKIDGSIKVAFLFLGTLDIESFKPQLDSIDAITSSSYLSTELINKNNCQKKRIVLKETVDNWTVLIDHQQTADEPGNPIELSKTSYINKKEVYTSGIDYYSKDVLFRNWKLLQCLKLETTDPYSISKHITILGEKFSIFPIETTEDINGMMDLLYVE